MCNFHAVSTSGYCNTIYKRSCHVLQQKRTAGIHRNLTISLLKKKKKKTLVTIGRKNISSNLIFSSSDDSWKRGQLALP